MSFAEVLHQDAAQVRVQRALGANRLPHAFLFTGPAGVGREMFAERLARLLLCAQPVEQDAPDFAAKITPTWRDACGTCTDCELFTAGTHPDFHRIHRRLNRLHPDGRVQRRKALKLSVEVIRHFLVNQIGLCPARGRARVFVVTEAERMSNQAQNALLKTLEEPPGPGYLILIATSSDAMLATTRSRCHHVRFGRLPTASVVSWLVDRHGAEAASAQLLAELAEGSLGLAARYLEMGLLEHLPALLKALRQASGDPVGASGVLQDIAKKIAPAFKEIEDEEAADTNANREAQKTVLIMAATILRDVQRAAIGLAPAGLPEERAVPAMAAAATPLGMARAIKAVSAVRRDIDMNANTALLFDKAAVEAGRGLTGAGR